MNSLISKNHRRNDIMIENQYHRNALMQNE